MYIPKITRSLFTEILGLEKRNWSDSTQFEIERRFVVKYLPENLNQHPHERITQGYLQTNDGTSVRLRKEKGKYYQTTKTGSGKVRAETNIEISKELFDALWHLTKGRRLEKTRYEIPYKGRTIQLDIYHGKLRGLITCEVEFDSEKECDKFEPPNWFGKEVTENKNYSNKNLAANGIPKGTQLHK